MAVVHPREVAAVLLAAGASRRMGRDKLTLDLGKGPLVRLVAQAALASRCKSVLVVTGPDGQAVREALEGMPVGFTVNPNTAEGMATSLRAGLAALDDNIEAAIVCLGDMPETATVTIDALVEAFTQGPKVAAIVPTYDGRRGNPVLLARRLFAEAQRLEGDAGARKLLVDRDDVVELPVDDPGIHLDLDDEAAVAAYRG